MVLLRHTPDPQRACAAAARQCYSPSSVAQLQEKMSEGQVEGLLDRIVSGGHHSVLEHACFTFAVEGVSRTLTHQLVRHRVASYSQQSQRYVKEKDLDYVVPPRIRVDEGLAKKFEEVMRFSQEAYAFLLESGVKKEDARFVLPNASETKIVVTMNARELLHFFKVRTCNRAQWEIHALADRMLHECRKVAPVIFKYAGPTCVTERICWEGEMACEKWKAIEGAEVRKRG